MINVYRKKDIEQGFLLGCSSRSEWLDYCYQIPPYQAGKYFYTPNDIYADMIVKKWAEQNICFCGFIHSHVIEKNELSENDIDYAEKLFVTYQLPILWFGVAIVHLDNIIFRFYSVTKDEKIRIKIVDYEIVDDE